MIERLVEAGPPRPASPPDDTVVVGLTGHLADNERALWEAALWAARHHRDVTLLPAGGEHPAPSARPTPTRRRRETRQLLDAAAHRLAATTDVDQRIRTIVVPGAADAALLDASTTASLVVVQRRDVGRREQRACRSVADDVVGRAACPVLVVHDRDQTGVRRDLLVILDAPTAVGPSACVAFPEAMSRGRGITFLVLRSSSRHGPGDWWSALADEDRISAWRRRFPRVPVTEVLVDRFDAATASRLAAGCELLVVARRPSSHTGRRHLGGVVRRLVDDARCPVLVVPPQPPRSAAGPAPSGPARSRSSGPSATPPSADGPRRPVAVGSGRGTDGAHSLGHVVGGQDLDQEVGGRPGDPLQLVGRRGAEDLDQQLVVDLGDVEKTEA